MKCKHCMAPMSNRKLVLLDPAGFDLGRGELDLSGVANADTQAPIMAMVTQKCECCGSWSEVARLPLPNWDEKEPTR